MVLPYATYLRVYEPLSALPEPDRSRWARHADSPRAVADRVEADFERWRRRGDTRRSSIMSSTRQVPFVWFIPFAAPDRRLALDAPSDLETVSGGAGRPRPFRPSAARRPTMVSVSAVSPSSAGGSRGSADALVELDHGGLVHLMGDLMGDAAPRADRPAAKVAAVLDGMLRDPVVARATYERSRGRWRSVQALSTAN
jgi:hypothetical protein